MIKSLGVLFTLAVVAVSEGALLHLLSAGLALKTHVLTAKSLKPAVPVKLKLYAPSHPYPPAIKPPSHYGVPIIIPPLPPITTTIPPPTTTQPPPPPPTTTHPPPPPPTTTQPPPPPPPPTTTTTPAPPPETTLPPYIPHEIYGIPVTLPAIEPPTEEPPHNPEDCPLTVLQENLYNLENTFGENPTSQVVVYPAIPANPSSPVQETYWQTVINPASPAVEDPNPSIVGQSWEEPAPNPPIVGQSWEDPAPNPPIVGQSWQEPVQPEQAAPYPPSLSVPAVEDPTLIGDFNHIGEAWSPPNVPSWEDPAPNPPIVGQSWQEPVQPEQAAPYPPSLSVPAVEDPTLIGDFNHIGEAWSPPNVPVVPALQYGAPY
ncbi:uncharacterized protein LOC131688288 [Topomyia yanbarensis]|uniref:uncharacterized protein LOC131688288 n=1 Tax=Topomyia yanbarensis TaxID=2498891 RepID=UPI00273AF15A|nr:uncharacterized protein LOC131688288 [Topomyia yanbarensis]